MPKARIWDQANGQWLILDAQNANRAATAALADDSQKLNGQDASFYATAQSVTDASQALADHKASKTDHAAATATDNGFMSAADKVKLDGVSVEANKVTVATEGSGFIEIDGVSKKIIDSLSAGNITEDATHRFVTDLEKTTWNAKIDQAKLGVANGVATLDASGLVPVSQIPLEYREAKVAADIAAMNAIADKYEGLHVLVLDATGDATVDAGYAEYVYDGTSFVKVAEGESMDVVLDWANIINKPSSTVAAIDDAVSKAHVHSNKTILDLITEAFTVELKAKIDGIIEGATKTEASTNNGFIKINGVEVEVYRHPTTHTSAEISDFATAVKAIKVDNAASADFATTAGNALKINGYELVIGAVEPLAKSNGMIWIDAAI